MNPYLKINKKIQVYAPALLCGPIFSSVYKLKSDFHRVPWFLSSRTGKRNFFDDGS